MIAINPLAVSRYRDRHSPSRGESNAGNAFVLANILRTDPHAHRPLPVDSELAPAIHVLARAHQDAVWDRMQTANKLRSVLREYYPTFLTAFDDLWPGSPRDAAPGTVTGARASRAQAGPHRRAAACGPRPRHPGRRRRDPHRPAPGAAPVQPQGVETAMSQHATALLHALDTAVANVTRLEESLTAAFQQHPDAEIITSFPA